MSVNKFNPEHYYDPTPYEALKKVEKEERKAAFRPIIYVCSPFSGNVRSNIEKAKDYCRFVINNGGIPLAPHLLFPQFLSDDVPEERELAIFMDIALLSKCAELWVFGDTVSSGMSIEINKAKKKRQKIRYFNSNCEEVFKL